ncbi:MAG: hypothetical protein AAFN44_03135 [Pseudomonadota bacterium]
MNDFKEIHAWSDMSAKSIVGARFVLVVDTDTMTEGSVGDLVSEKYIVNCALLIAHGSNATDFEREVDEGLIGVKSGEDEVFFPTASVLGLDEARALAETWRQGEPTTVLVCSLDPNFLEKLLSA